MKFLILILIASCPFGVTHFQVGKNVNNTEITVADSTSLIGTRWQLIELSKTIIPPNTTAKEMYFILGKDSSVTGNGGCNKFSGTYSLDKNNSIRFGEMIRTNVSCPAIKFESTFLNVLSLADHYDLNGDTLSLTEGKLMLLAKFVADKKQ